MWRAAIAVLVVACRAAPPAAPAASPAAVAERLSLRQLPGDWRWLHVSRDGDTMILERERWHFDPVVTGPGAEDTVTGSYRRDVSVIALDGKPFLCAQQTSYVQSARYDVRATIVDSQILVDELAYQTADSPCEPGIRTLGRYVATVKRDALRLTWAEGDQTLEPTTEAASLDLAAPPGDAAHAIAGAWHWTLRSRDPEGYARQEDEAWELAVADDGTIGGTYVRTVTTYSEDGSIIPCAGSSQWRYIDRYSLRGHTTEDGFRVEEAAVDAGTHPCLATTPTRHLDAANGEAVGDFLQLEWRGKRKQVLHRD